MLGTNKAIIRFFPIHLLYGIWLNNRPLIKLRISCLPLPVLLPFVNLVLGHRAQPQRSEAGSHPLETGIGTMGTCYTLCDLFVQHLCEVSRPHRPTKQNKSQVGGQGSELCEEEVVGLGFFFFFFSKQQDTSHSCLFWQPSVSQAIQILALPLKRIALEMTWKELTARLVDLSRK